MIRYLFLALTLALSGCDTNKNSDALQRAIDPEQAGLMFMFPATGQENVSQRSPIFLRFTHPVVAGTQDPSEFVQLVRESDGVVVNANVRLVADDFEQLTIIEIMPAQLLQPSTSYIVRSPSGVPLSRAGERLVRPLKAFNADDLKFTTASAIKGSLAEMSTSDEFKVRNQAMVPRAADPLTDSFPLVDFSTIRLELTQPILPASARYGAVCDSANCPGSVSLQDSNNQHVPARLFVAGRKMVIDPISDLSPDLTYSLVLKSGAQGVRSQFNRTLTGDTTFVLGRPLDSTIAKGSREAEFYASEEDFLLNGFKAEDCRLGTSGRKNADGSDEQGFFCGLKRQRAQIILPQNPGISGLSGRESNLSPVEADFLGRGDDAPKPKLVAFQNANSKKGQLFGEVANPPSFGEFVTRMRNRETIPLRVFAGNKLTAEPLQVKLLSAEQGLETPLGGDGSTGELTITLISDATGFVVPNLYNPSDDVPALVKLYLDVAVTAANPDADGAFTQNILHVEANGVATVDQANQRLLIDSVGLIDIKILGTDDAIAILSLKLVSDLSNPDEFIPFVAEVDDLKVVSWVPGSINQPRFAGLKKAGIAQAGELIRPGDPLLVSFSAPIDPAALDQVTLTANGVAIPFNARVDGSTLIISPTSPLSYGQSYSIGLVGIRALAKNSVTLPTETLDFALPKLVNPTGRSPVVLRTYPGYPCPTVGGSFASDTQGRCAGGKVSGGDADDVLPLARIAPDRDIEVVFSQSINEATVNRGFEVFRVQGEANVERVPGVITFRDRTLRFKPNEPWQKGTRYRYVLHSQASGCGGKAICGTNGLPLQTQLIAQSLAPVQNPQRGGPNMEIAFVGGDPVIGTVTELRGFPTSDVDANFLFEPNRSSSGAISSGAGERLSVSTIPLGSGVDPACTAQELQASITASPAGSAPQPSAGRRCILPNGALLQPDTTDGLSRTPRAAPSFGGAATSFALGCKDGTQPDMLVDLTATQSDANAVACQGNQFLHITSALSARIVELDDKDNYLDLLFSQEELNRFGNDKVVRVEIDPSIIITSGPDIYASLGLTTDASEVLPLQDGINIITGLLGFLPLIGEPLANAIDAAIEQGEAALNGLLTGLGIVNVAPVNTGPLVFRMRYEVDETTNARTKPASGVIYQAEERGPNGEAILKLRTRLELYTDIPEIDAAAEIAGLELIKIGHKARSNQNLSEVDCQAPGGLNCAIVVEGAVNFLEDGRLTIALSNVNDVRLQADLFGDLPFLPEGTLSGFLRVIVPKGRFGVDASLPPLKDAEPIAILLNQ